MSIASVAVQSNLQAAHNMISTTLRIWIDAYLARLESGECRIWHSDEPLMPGDRSGFLAEVDLCDIAHKVTSIESALRLTYSGQTEATFESGMGLRYLSDAAAILDLITDLVWSHIGERPDDDPDWTTVVCQWESDLWDAVRWDDLETDPALCMFTPRADRLTTMLESSGPNGQMSDRPGALPSMR